MLAALAAVGTFAAVHLLSAARAGTVGRNALTHAESDLRARRLDSGRSNLSDAKDAFSKAQAEVRALGPLAAIARRTPLIGRQIKAVDALTDAGLALSDAGLDLVNAASALTNPSDQQLPVSAAVDALRSTHDSLLPAVSAIDFASARVGKVKGSFLLGPLAQARRELSSRLPRIRAQAESAKQGTSALIDFAGGSGPKRYLFLSQNPDEVRPTGGFIGTYGVLTADNGKIQLDRYDAIESWTLPRPEAAIPSAEAGSPFRFLYPPTPQRLANVNSGPDWPTAARLAAQLWERGGEGPVDGVISFTPGFLGRILSVIGPVTLPTYGETVTAANLNQRLDFQTHQAPPPPGAYRKDFVALLAETIMQRLLDAPTSQWEPLGRAMGVAFDAREAVAWSKDEKVAKALSDRRWDGTFPSGAGDFYFNAEFAFASKNGRGIRRTFDHVVSLRPDGSARITTKMTLTNTEPPEQIVNESTLAYHTIYGPEGAVFDQAASDPLGVKEPAVAGHPAMGWFRAAKPGGGQETLTTVWDAPNVARPRSDGTWQYSLIWPYLPDHSGDVVNLKIELPPGWKWNGDRPPTKFPLDRDLKGSWLLSARL